MGSGSNIIVCGQRFDVGQRVVTFQDDPQFSAYTMHRTDKPSEIYPFQPAKGMGQMAGRYRERRLIGSDRSIERLKQVMRQFIVHHDGCQDSKTCFHVLHNERGLSVHFLIDNDGTIYQTLDLVDCAFQAAGVNEISVGVELANRGDAQRFPNDYHGKRDKVTCTIQGHQFLAYAYTKPQMESMISLGKSLARIFPNLPQAYPQINGDPLWRNIPDPREFAGYMGHYHVTDQKWDPGPFDFKYFTSKIRGKSVFPLVLSGDKPDLPDDPEAAEDAAKPFFENNEQGEGGYFPVGPIGESRLWHGGTHIHADRGTPVYAPFGGKVVAARMTDDSPIGSTNFVLLKHEMAVGTANLKFWSLFFHLDEEQRGSSAPSWFTRAANQLANDAVSLAKDNIEVGAGELIGHVGEAGPPGRFEGQVHIEIFSTDEIGEMVEPGFWKTVDGAGMGRFCSSPEIIDKIDKGAKKDGLLSRLELMNFYHADPSRDDFHKMAVRHLTEWADNNDWEVALSRTKDFAAMPSSQRKRLFHDQIQPVLWWSDDVADPAGLPSDKIVWSYHPITFIVWLHNRMRNTATTGAGITSAADFNGKAAPSHIKDDGDAMEGFTDDEDILFGAAGKKLELEDLANGYPDEPKKK